MDGTNSKISFIPKGSLVHEESFLERPRPRSAMGILSIIALIVSAGSYFGLNFYSDSIDMDRTTKAEQINQLQKKFSDAPQVGEAQLFRLRAEFAREILDEHTTVSPVFDFLSANTVQSIFFDRFSFARSLSGATVALSGEAPSYAVLASQGDILRSRTAELSNFTISRVVLSKSGTVTFDLSLVFKPEYISYARSLARITRDASSPRMATTTSAFGSRGSSTPSVMAPSMIMATSGDLSLATVSSTTGNGALSQDTQVAQTGASLEKKSALRSFFESLWTRFKFW